MNSKCRLWRHHNCQLYIIHCQFTVCNSTTACNLTAAVTNRVAQRYSGDPRKGSGADGHRSLWLFGFSCGDGGGHDELTDRKLPAPFFLIFPGNGLFLNRDFLKACGLDHSFQVFDRRRAADSARMHIGIVFHLLRNLLHDHNVADGDSAAGLQNPENLPVHPALVGG